MAVDTPDRRPDRVPGPAPAGTLAERLLAHLLETVSVLAPDGTLLYSSREHVGVLGHGPDAHLGHRLLDPQFIHPDDHGRVLDGLRQVLSRPDAEVSGEFRVRHRDGSWATLEAQAWNRLDDPVIGGIVLATRNVTERVRAQEEADRSQERFQALLQRASDLVLVLDDSLRTVFATPAARTLLGRSPGELYALPHLQALVHDADRPVLLAAIEQAKHTGESVSVQFRVLHADEAVRWLAATISDLRGLPSVGGLVVNAHDVTRHAQFEAALAHQATHDPLTGVPNRTLLMDRLDQALGRARRGAGTVTVFFVDLDRLKAVNDSFGHHCGDRVLQEAARRLRTTLRPTDTVARLGGDEFIVVAEGITTEEHRSVVARRLLTELARPHDISGEQVVVSASIGIATADADLDDPEELVRRADAAMYLAKSAGRNRWAAHDGSRADRSTHDLAAEVALRRGIDADQFVVHYQPEFDPKGRVTGVEALVRWHHPERGLLLPGDFLPLAEDSGLMVSLGRLVLRRALEDARRWAHHGVRTWVNLSAHELMEPGLPERIAALAADVGLPAAVLGVEVTESALVAQASRAADTLVALQAVGVAVALDDFGTGFSSLTHLKAFPVDVLKIDRSFVSFLPDDEDDSSIVAAIVAMAHALGLEVVAEGIETERQRDLLRSLGVDHLQGFLLCRPTTADVVAALPMR